jgi:beta-galactosidase
MLVKDEHRDFDSSPENLRQLGWMVPTAHLAVKFELSGPGAIIGLNNGDPTCHEPEKSDQHNVFLRLAQVILQSAPSGHGEITLRAISKGLTPGETLIQVTPAPARPALPIARPPPVNRELSRQ